MRPHQPFVRLNEQAFAWVRWSAAIMVLCFIKWANLGVGGFEIAALYFYPRDHHGELSRLLKSGR
jgi:hypothetical protein